MIMKSTIFRFLRIAIALLGLFIASQLSINIKPIPITMQTVAVMLIGLLMTTQEAIVVIAGYLILGYFGLPMFSNFSYGPEVLYGPTGGYLWGFLPAVIAMCLFKQVYPRANSLRALDQCLIGTAVILSCGTLWLAKDIGFSAAFAVGFKPFVVPGVIKIALTLVMWLVIVGNWKSRFRN